MLMELGDNAIRTDKTMVRVMAVYLSCSGLAGGRCISVCVCPSARPSVLILMVKRVFKFRFLFCVCVSCDSFVVYYAIRITLFRLLTLHYKIYVFFFCLTAGLVITQRTDCDKMSTINHVPFMQCCQIRGHFLG